MSSAVSKPQDEKEQAMLNINPETVCHIIEKAREFQAKEQVVIPDVQDSPADDWQLQSIPSSSRGIMRRWNGSSAA